MKKYREKYPVLLELRAKVNMLDIRIHRAPDIHVPDLTLCLSILFESLLLCCLTESNQ